MSVKPLRGAVTGASKTSTSLGFVPPGWLWLRLSLAAAVLALIGSVIGLTVPSIYATLTPASLP